MPARPLRIHRWLALLALAVCANASAQTVYKCTDSQGNLSFQDAPCHKDVQQRILHLHVPTPPPGAGTVATTRSSPSRPEPASPAPARPAPAPRTYTLPQLYQCMRATDGKTYVSRNGHPPAYRAPLGILGAFQLPLSETYGGKDATTRAASDPQLAKGRITPGLVAGNYTWVQDRCRPMSIGEICETLSGQLEKTQAAIHKAFKSDRPPLQKKADTLRREMAGCGR